MTKEDSVPPGGEAIPLVKFATPKNMLIAAAVLLLGSLPFAYWSLLLHAPQYPDGLRLDIYVTRMTGDISEVDGLNHYIGMAAMGDMATFERAIWPYAMVAVALLAVAPLVLRRRRSWMLLAIPAVLPVVFSVGMQWRLYRAGHDLDPTAAMSSSIKPFTPKLFGDGVIGQFHTVARFGLGFYMALAAALLAIAAYRVESRKRSGGREDVP